MDDYSTIVKWVTKYYKAKEFGEGEEGGEKERLRETGEREEKER